MSDAFVAVGSNINAEKNIPAALQQLQSRVCVIGTSAFYRTESVGGAGQPPYSNGVWRIGTAVPPRALKFDILREVESELGRLRTGKRSAARTIDLDLILYDDFIVNEPDLVLPDPLIRERSFIAVPLLELAPDLVFPDTGETLASLSIACDPALQVLENLTLALRNMIHSE
jgi:2-amino-4-hydroxy-6-hydroxymethyldihydropteridine diphosphokinase